MTIRSLRVISAIAVGAGILFLALFLRRSNERQSTTSPEPERPFLSTTQSNTGDGQAAPSPPESTSSSSQGIQPKALTPDLYTKVQNAKAIYEAWAKAQSGGNAEEASKLLAKLNELDDECARFFVDRFRESDERDPDELAMTLALACGGKDVAEFLRTYVGAGAPSSDKRDLLLHALCSGSGYPFSLKNIPMDEGLVASAVYLTQSRDPDERAAGASLLQTTPGQRTRLLELAETDSDLGVKYEAIRSLGLVGDRDTLTYLERYESAHATLLQKVDQESGGRLRKVLRAAVDELRTRVR